MPQSNKQTAMCPECGADISVGASSCPDCGVFFGDGNLDNEDTHMRSTLIESSAPEVPGRSPSPRAPARPAPRRGQQNSPPPRRPARADDARRSPPRSRPNAKNEDAKRRPEPKPAAAQRNKEQASREPKVKRPAQRSPQAQRPRHAAPAVPAHARPKAAPKVRGQGATAEPPARPGPNRPAKNPQAQNLRADSSPRSLPLSSLNLVAVELEESIDQAIHFASDSDLADKITILSALFALIASFLPWSGRNIGIFVGAGPLFFFLISSFALTILRRQRLKQADEGMIDEDSNGNDLDSVRQYNLLQIFSGFGALLYLCAVGLGYYYASQELFDLRFGWYVALFFSAGLAYGGIARFVRDARRLHKKTGP